MEIKNVDSQGRISLPKKWRSRYLKGKKAIILSKGDIVEVRAFVKPDLTSHFDSVEVDLKSDLSDWHSVRRELRHVQP